MDEFFFLAADLASQFAAVAKQHGKAVAVTEGIALLGLFAITLLWAQLANLEPGVPPALAVLSWLGRACLVTVFLASILLWAFAGSEPCPPPPESETSDTRRRQSDRRTRKSLHCEKGAACRP